MNRNTSTRPLHSPCVQHLANGARVIPVQNPHYERSC